MSLNAQYASTPATSIVQISTANTNRDGTGTLGTLALADSLGTGLRIDDVTITAEGTTTAGVVRLFLNDGTNTRLWKEILVQAVTPSTTVAVWSTTLKDLALILNPGWSVKASTHNAETFNLAATRAGEL